MTMLAALGALAAGAVAGIYLAFRHFTRKRLPAWVALLHGIGGATGFTIVLFTVVRMPTFSPIREVLYLLIATVALGCINLLFHIRKKRHRSSLIILHGLTAVSAASMLVRAVVLHFGEVPDAHADAPKLAAKEHDAKASAAKEPAVKEPAAKEPDAKEPDAKEPDAKAPEEDEPEPPPPSEATPPAKKDEAPPAEFAVDAAIERVLARPVRFDTESADPSEDSRSALDEIASTLKAHPEVALVEVQGHADARGSAKRNVKLTRARARKVVSALVDRGVAEDRLRAAGYGARCPTDPSCRENASCWENDRRVVFKVLRVGDAQFRGELVCERGAGLIPAADRRFHTD